MELSICYSGTYTKSFVLSVSIRNESTPMGMDVLVISPCSGTKRFDAVICLDEIDSSNRTNLLREYADSVASTAEMYTGREHGYIRFAIKQLSEVADVD